MNFTYKDILQSFFSTIIILLIINMITTIILLIPSTLLIIIIMQVRSRSPFLRRPDSADEPSDDQDSRLAHQQRFGNCQMSTKGIQKVQMDFFPGSSSRPLHSPPHPAAAPPRGRLALGDPPPSTPGQSPLPHPSSDPRPPQPPPWSGRSPPPPPPSPPPPPHPTSISWPR